MARDRAVYRPRNAEASVLHLVIREHLEEFLRAAANRADGARLPEFIVREFREFLTCGVLAHGFARVRCGRCAFERLVPFDLDVLRCPRCAGRMELIATVDDPAVVVRILAHLGLPGARDGPEPAASVAPPRDDQPTLPFALP